MVLPLRVPRPGTPMKSPALPGVGSAFRRPAPTSGARRVVAEVAAARAAAPTAFAPQRLRVVSPTPRVASPPPIRVTPVRDVGKARPAGRVVSPEPINPKGVAPHGTVEVWFVRHGETVANASRITQGQQPGRLTRTGALQAAALGERLRRDHDIAPFDVVLCSDLLRCRQTCHLATKGWGHEPKIARTDPLLRERAVGVYEGLAHDAPRKPRPPHVHPRRHRVEGGESWEDVNRRARRLLARLGSTFVSASKDGASSDRLRVLCVTHGGFIMEAMSVTPSPKSTPLFDALMACAPRCKEDGTAHSMSDDDKRSAGDGFEAPMRHMQFSPKPRPVTRKMSPLATPWDGVTSVTTGAGAYSYFSPASQ